MTTTSPKHPHTKKPAHVEPAPVAAMAPDGSVIDAAAHRLDARIKAVAPESVLPISVDIPGMVLTMLGSAQRIGEHLPSLRQLAFYDAGPAAEITDYAYALFDAHQRTLSVVEDRTFEKQIQRATVLRARFVGTLDMLVAWDQFDAAAVAAIRAGTGYRDLVSDVVNCVRYLRALPPDLRARLLVTDAELDEAMALAASLEHALAAREEGTTLGAADPGVRRQQAYTLAVHAWDEIRRGLQFLRSAQGDADAIAPSLFAKGSARRAGGTDAPAAPGAPATPSAPTAPNGPPASAPAVPSGPPAVVASAPIPPGKHGGPFTT